jgi:hypothetical protein
MQFALLMDDEGSISALSYDWKDDIRLPASLLISLELFNEGRETFKSYSDDADIAADIFIAKMKINGWEVQNEQTLRRHMVRLCEPGPPSNGPLLFEAMKVERES